MAKVRKLDQIKTYDADLCWPTASANITYLMSSIPILSYFNSVHGTATLKGSLGWTSDTYANCNSKFQPWIWHVTHSYTLWPLSSAHAMVSASGSAPSATASYGISARVYSTSVINFGVEADAVLGVVSENKVWVSSKCGCMKVKWRFDLFVHPKQNFAPATATAVIVGVVYGTPVVQSLAEVIGSYIAKASVPAM